MLDGVNQWSQTFFSSTDGLISKNIHTVNQINVTKLKERTAMTKIGYFKSMIINVNPLCNFISSILYHCANNICSLVTMVTFKDAFKIRVTTKTNIDAWKSTTDQNTESVAVSLQWVCPIWGSFWGLIALL